MSVSVCMRVCVVYYRNRERVKFITMKGIEWYTYASLHTYTHTYRTRLQIKQCTPTRTYNTSNTHLFWDAHRKEILINGLKIC